MKYIPLIRTKEIKKQNQIADLFSTINTNERTVSSVYLLDEQGIRKNHPSLSIHQYAHRWFDTIVDAGCHHIGDVVDILLAGAQIVVIRPTHWKEPDFLSIRDISESEIYMWYEFNEERNNKRISTKFYAQADGIILNIENVSNPLPFTVRDELRILCTKHPVEKIVIFDPLQTHERELDSFDFKTMIVNIDLLHKNG